MAAASLALSLGLGAPLAVALDVGDVAPAVVGAGLDGSALPSLSGKVVIVDFWASWCEPCKAELPVLEQLHAKYRDRGLVVVGVNIDKDAAKAKAFADKLGLTFPLVHDASHDMAKRYAPPTMPSSYVIDRSGKVRFVHAGFHAKDREKLEKEVVGLL